MQYNIMGAEGVGTLADAFSSNSSIRQIKLCGNRMSSEGAMVLAGTLKNNFSLQHLDLRDNILGVDGATQVASLLFSEVVAEMDKVRY